jgi:glucuronate isomerase
MKKFMDKDFLLNTETAEKLFDISSKEPIFDYHCHLSPKKIYENKPFDNISELWLSGDHYKWRAMRGCGVEEKYITGTGSDYEKFKAWAQTVPYCIGNPLYRQSQQNFFPHMISAGFLRVSDRFAYQHGKKRSGSVPAQGTESVP